MMAALLVVRVTALCYCMPAVFPFIVDILPAYTPNLLFYVCFIFNLLLLLYYITCTCDCEYANVGKSCVWWEEA